MLVGPLPDVCLIVSLFVCLFVCPFQSACAGDQPEFHDLFLMLLQGRSVIPDHRVQSEHLTMCRFTPCVFHIKLSIRKLLMAWLVLFGFGWFWLVLVGFGWFRLILVGL